MVSTEARPRLTRIRDACAPSASTLNRLTTLSSCPNTGRPTNSTSSIRSSSIVPSTVRSGRAPRGNSPSSATSTVTVPFSTAGSMRVTCPGMTPLRVSMAAV